MSLVLEIEFLTGVCRAAHGVDDDSPEWPPQPDRVFSALVSAWGVRGEDPEERIALEWLETQPSPDIRASGYSARTAPSVFVPPNDSKASTSLKAYIQVLPERRKRQPRKFPVARPDDPNIELIWPNIPDAKVLNALNALAGCVGYVGHSASLARCHFHVGDADKSKMVPARRRVYPGRLLELETAHRAKPNRPVIRAGASVFTEDLQITQPQVEWLVLEAIGGEIPDIRASALVCRLLRQALMAGYQMSGLGDAIPEIVSGHAPDGTPTRLPHLAVVPMTFTGSRFADGRVFGFALIPPPGESLTQIDGFRAAFEVIAPYYADSQRRILSLQGFPLRRALELSPSPDYEGRKQSLLPTPFLKESSCWASVTPIVLERHLKRKDDREVRELVAYACENAGQPRPNLERIQVGKHSAVTGAPPARPLVGEPSWMRWRLPKSLESRQLIHAVIDFEQNVQGPVLLGAGRFTGLGLCRSLER